MNILSLLCNTVLLGFTSFVVLTEGGSEETGYIIFACVLVAIPLLNIALTVRHGARYGWLRLQPLLQSTPPAPNVKSDLAKRPKIETIAIAGNVVLLGFSCWAIIDQHPHPQEPGVLEYEALVLLTPILSAMTIIRNRMTRGPDNQPGDRFDESPAERRNA